MPKMSQAVSRLGLPHQLRSGVGRNVTLSPSRTCHCTAHVSQMGADGSRMLSKALSPRLVATTARERIRLMWYMIAATKCTSTRTCSHWRSGSPAAGPAHRVRRVLEPAGRLDGARPAARAPHAPRPPQRPRRQRQAPVAEPHAALRSGARSCVLKSAIAGMEIRTTVGVRWG